MRCLSIPDSAAGKTHTHTHNVDAVLLYKHITLILTLLFYLSSENELTSCSLQVLSPTGSPGRALLAVLADRFCSLDFLLNCLVKIDHQEAVQYLTSTG